MVSVFACAQRSCLHNVCCYFLCTLHIQSVIEYISFTEWWPSFTEWWLSFKELSRLLEPEAAKQEVEIAQTEESLQRHRDSVSTLGYTSSASMPPGPQTVLELQGDPKASSELPGGPLSGAAITRTVVAVSSPTEEPLSKVLNGSGAPAGKVKSLEVS